jgi:hypothetical protein
VISDFLATTVKLPFITKDLLIEMCRQVHNGLQPAALNSGVRHKLRRVKPSVQNWSLPKAKNGEGLDWIPGNVYDAEWELDSRRENCYICSRFCRL